MQIIGSAFKTGEIYQWGIRMVCQGWSNRDQLSVLFSKPGKYLMGFSYELLTQVIFYTDYGVCIPNRENLLEAGGNLVRMRVIYMKIKDLVFKTGENV